jgi:CRP/FNR family cyclic AMP-dependent transcriptional regulator
MALITHDSSTAYGGDLHAHIQAERPRTPREFELGTFLDSAGASRAASRFTRSSIIFAQGDPATSVMYIKKGTVKLSVIARSGKEAVVGVLGPGDFFGEGSLAGQAKRMATASAVTATTVLVVEKQQMVRLLRKHPPLAERFLTHMLARNIRIEADLVDQLFNSSEKRLARTLLLLAQYGHGEPPLLVLPKLSQETLAEMIGTTRSRVNFFMNKFRKLGFIEYNGRLTINTSLLSVLLHN